jgi:hypothetical protein
MWNHQKGSPLNEIKDLYFPAFFEFNIFLTFNNQENF